MEQWDPIIRQVVAGDTDAFAEMYNQTIHQVYRTLYFLTDNKSDLDDMVQEIYVELYKSLPRYDSSRPFQAWFYGITIRQHQAYRRKQWRCRRDEATEHQILADRLSEPDFADSLVNKVSNEDLLSDIQSISYKSQQIIILHYLNELTQEEIAETLQIPLGTVKSRLHTALSQLRKTVRRERNA